MTSGYLKYYVLKLVFCDQDKKEQAIERLVDLGWEYDEQTEQFRIKKEFNQQNTDLIKNQISLFLMDGYQVKQLSLNVAITIMDLKRSH